jgi:hypothetical protein
VERPQGRSAPDGKVAGGVGANLPAFILAVVAVALAIGAIRRTSRRALRGKGLGSRLVAGGRPRHGRGSTFGRQEDETR